MDVPALGAPAPSGSSSALPYTLRSAPAGVLVITLASGVPFEVLRTAIRELLAEVPARFRGARVRLDFGDRDLELFDLRRLLTLLKEFDIEVVGLHLTPTALHKYAERELKLKVHLSAPVLEKAVDVMPAGEELPTEIVSEPVPADDHDATEHGGRVLTVPGHVRSGAMIRFSGDVQIFGDVNPGAQIVAGGSIYVYGALKGLASAGTRGEDTAVVFALDMRPSQIRIGRVIHIGADAESDRPSRQYLPEIAWISEGAILIEPYRGRHPHLKELS